jgi:hypothetical protein
MPAVTFACRDRKEQSFCRFAGVGGTIHFPRGEGEWQHSNLVPKSPAKVKAEFDALVKQWKEDTEFESTIAQMTRHPAYRKIIGLGEAAVPLLLAELKRRPDFWFAALRELTNADPVPKEAAGKVKQMAKAWLEWGRGKGYIE